MKLGLVIPVRNDQAVLTRLLRQARDMGIFEQIVVVDDGSDTPVVLPRLRGVSTTLVRNDRARGPGPARNRGFEQVATSHVLFFDSDDMLTRDLVALWQDLQGQHFDFCLFRYCDTRHLWRGRRDMLPYDQALWRQAGMGARVLAPVTGPARMALAQTGNYPWNKIWRAEVLRTHDIRYSDIFVHEDIAPHWMGFLHAREILASDRLGAVHHVAPDATRLTNLRSRERLAVFEALDFVLSRLGAAPSDRPALVPAFLRFTADLLDWIHGVLDPALHPELARRRGAFWRRSVPPALFDQLARTDPELALRLSLQMLPEEGPGIAC